MPHDNQPLRETAHQSAEPSRESPLSLSRLREAFAAMLGEPAAKYKDRDETAKGENEPSNSNSNLSSACEINPHSVVEAMLFVGRPDNGPISARELAGAMRGVSPAEIKAAVNDLNELYDADQAPYLIEQSGSGYRLALRPEFERARNKFYGRVKEARLSPAALEVLSVLAYNQPATIEQLNELRCAACGAALATLVRRKLVRLDRETSSKKPPLYSTTERFLKLFGLESLAALPRSEELENI